MKILLQLMLTTLILFSSACSVAPKIHSNISPEVDFSRYKTFGYFKPLDTDKRYESLLSQFLKQATTAEMTRRGFTYTDKNPDLLINFHTNIVNKQKIHQTPVSMGYYDYRYNFYYGVWPGYQVHVDDYQEGTLNIDIVDRKQNKMIWEGIAIGRITQDKLDNLQQTIQSTVSEIFTRFPVAEKY